ncbi:MAG: tRNA (adenosine(37)-N6)-threonylcarbamoyltransferase complex ATPase subunit type 1 TsaE [Ignavibacteria bacterium RBG_16_36_9]|nr:MAG: tRNA (adenosine(37)-N6)-threonylcarbamoyltransferase complex ATPase subunit type 1 TsaE [Ignavibacteria bacterium RBG_16_36_9]
MIEYPSTIKIISEAATASLASDFILSCKKGDRVVLNGDLGAGKTFFIRAALISIGITNVNSPSFAIVNEYQNKFHICHFDFYRLKNSAELYDIGWQDYVNDDDSIMFIEWGNRLPSVLPAERIEINIVILNGTEREFRFEKFN